MDTELSTDKEREASDVPTSEANTIVTVPVSSDNPQQFILLSQTANGAGALSVDGSSGEPASKLIRLEGEDGQTYVLAVTGVAGDSAGSIADFGKADIATTEPSGLEATVQVKVEKDAVPGPSKKVSNTNSADDITQAWFTTRDDKRVLQSKGHTWKQGQWTKDETDLLMENIDSYCKERNIKDPTEIIFEMTKDERKDFYRTIARGLQRPLFSVYRRVTRMYDQKNHMGKYTPEEMSKLKELRLKHGNDWAAIGAVLGRSASSVKDKCRLMKDTCNAGKWLPDEERRLSSAVYDLAGAKIGESVTHGLSWASVAEVVGTRSEKQCRTKWLNYLNWKQKGGAEWTRQDDINLILKIASLPVSDDTEIDWNELSHDWPSVRSPQWLRGKWWSLKRHVPDYQDLVFSDIMEILKTMHYHAVRVKNPGACTRVQVQGRQSNCSMGLQSVPDCMQGGVSLEPGSEDSEATFQAYEVLQQWTPNSSNALLITQPHNNPAISFSGTNSMSTDHIIVHTLPVSQTDGEDKTGENVTVQMNPQPHVIISAAAGDETSLDGSVITTSIQLPDGMDSSEQDCHQYQLIDSQAEIISGQHAFATTAVSAADLSADVSQSVLSASSGTDIVVLEPTSPPHYSQSNSNDGNELMSGFSDPILTSDAAELMCSPSDCETDKSQPGLNEDIQ